MKLNFKNDVFKINNKIINQTVNLPKHQLTGTLHIVNRRLVEAGDG